MFGMRHVFPVLAVLFVVFEHAYVGVNGGRNNAHEYHMHYVSTNQDGSVNYQIDWVADKKKPLPKIYIGDRPGALKSVSGTRLSSVQENDSGGAIKTCWTATLSKLKPGQKVYYSLNKNSKNPRYLSPRDFSNNQESFTMAIAGDIGAPRQSYKASGVVMEALEKDVNAGVIDAFMNLGDHAYELKGRRGANYMHQQAKIGSKVPYYATIGNHEYFDKVTVGNYNKRFGGLKKGVGRKSGSSSDKYYSFNFGSVHIIVVNTEVYYEREFKVRSGGGRPFNVKKADKKERQKYMKRQLDWMKKDLSKVDRSSTPFVVVMGHRPLSQMPSDLHHKESADLVNGFLPLLAKVDAYICGHVHSFNLAEETKYKGKRIPPQFVVGGGGASVHTGNASKLKSSHIKTLKTIHTYGYIHLTATPKQLTVSFGTAASNGGHNPSKQAWKEAHTVNLSPKFS